MSKQAKESNKKKKAKPSGGDELSVAAHPRAAASVRRLKAWAGLAGFLVTAFLSQRAGAPLDVALERGLLAGLLLRAVMWAVAVTVWRQLVIAEMRAIRAEQLALLERRRAEEAA